VREYDDESLGVDSQQPVVEERVQVRTQQESVAHRVQARHRVLLDVGSLQHVLWRPARDAALPVVRGEEVAPERWLTPAEDPQERAQLRRVLALTRNRVILDASPTA
jgi:hypothetical protein